MTAAVSTARIILTLNLSLDVSQLEDDLNVDPKRLIQRLVGAIGILGAGANINTNETGRLRGVASGAAIWGVGGIGIACGMGYFAEAIKLAVTILAVSLAHDWISNEEDRE